MATSLIPSEDAREGNMALTPEAELVISQLNEQLNTLITNRDRLLRLFDDVLGVSIWTAIPANERHFIRDLIKEEMNEVVPNLESTINNIGLLQ